MHLLTFHFNYGIVTIVQCKPALLLYTISVKFSETSFVLVDVDQCVTLILC